MKLVIDTEKLNEKDLKVLGMAILDNIKKMMEIRIGMKPMYAERYSEFLGMDEKELEKYLKSKIRESCWKFKRKVWEETKEYERACDEWEDEVRDMKTKIDAWEEVMGI